MTDSERIAVLETKMDMFAKSQQDISDKLDSLLALKNKGAGAFWLASLLFGIVIAVGVNAVQGWFNHA